MYDGYLVVWQMTKDEREPERQRQREGPRLRATRKAKAEDGEKRGISQITADVPSNHKATTKRSKLVNYQVSSGEWV